LSKTGGHTDKFHVLELERTNGEWTCTQSYDLAILSSSNLEILDTFAIDIQLGSEFKVGRTVLHDELELLIPIIDSVSVNRVDRSAGMPTFPASLAMNAVSTDVPSCFTAYVSITFPPHTIATCDDSSDRDMILVMVGPPGNATNKHEAIVL
jgi:hypothetical protein